MLRTHAWSWMLAWPALTGCFVDGGGGAADPSASSGSAGTTASAPTGEGTVGATATTDTTGTIEPPTGTTSTSDDPTGDATAPALLSRTFLCKLISRDTQEGPTDNATQTRFNLTGT